MIESLRKENSNLCSTNAKILERVKEMKREIDRGYEEKVEEYRKECMGRMMDMIDKGVEESLKKERKKVEVRFGELDAGFQKEEEKWKRLEMEWREERDELIRERDLLKRKRGNVVLPSPRKTPMLEVVEKEVGIGLEQMVSQAMEGSKRRKVEAVQPRMKEEGFGKRFGALEEAVWEMKKGISRLLRARNEAAKRIVYRKALKACDDKEGADTEDDGRFNRRMEVIFKEEEALKRGKLWGEASANLIARARGRRGADMGKANDLGKKLERRVNKGKLGLGKESEKAAFVVSDGDDSILSDSDGIVRRLWLDRSGD
ncbi:hypothetical protein HOY80DRAFT_1059623 [Tuber brumale]|nr:hypothetical protein HOY80DRAFT_1059623 [Tuber brumale]